MVIAVANIGTDLLRRHGLFSKVQSASGSLVARAAILVRMSVAVRPSPPGNAKAARNLSRIETEQRPNLAAAIILASTARITRAPLPEQS
jgi:hypothetical protein